MKALTRYQASNENVQRGIVTSFNSREVGPVQACISNSMFRFSLEGNSREHAWKQITLHYGATQYQLIRQQDGSFEILLPYKNDKPKIKNFFSESALSKMLSVLNINCPMLCEFKVGIDQTSDNVEPESVLSKMFSVLNINCPMLCEFEDEIDKKNDNVGPEFVLPKLFSVLDINRPIPCAFGGKIDEEIAGDGNLTDDSDIVSGTDSEDRFADNSSESSWDEPLSPTTFNERRRLLLKKGQ